LLTTLASDDPNAPTGTYVLLALIAAFFGFLSYRKRHDTHEYQLFIVTSSGEAAALQTTDQAEVSQVRANIEAAMVTR
jgi:hypothetical protein